MDNIPKHPQSLWTPNPTTVKNSNLSKFTRLIEQKHQKFLKTPKIKNYNQLLEWSNSSYDIFWQECLDFCKITYEQNSKIPAQVCTSKFIHDKPNWFTNYELNYAENVFKNVKSQENKISVFSCAEGGKREVKRTWAEMREQAKAWAIKFKEVGVLPGDVVAGYMPNTVETVEAMLGATWIGAAWTSTSPDFGISGVLDRFKQSKPKILIGVDAIWYNDKVHDHYGKLSNVANQLENLKACIVVPFVNSNYKLPENSTFEIWNPDLENLQNTTAPEYHMCNFNDPLFVMYSSGTTGAPKCMVHSVGGTILEHAKEHILHLDMTNRDIMLYYTTTGWMMWNWLVGALLAGSSIVTYDGSPLKPNENFIWDLIDSYKITVLGTGAKWLQVLEQRGMKPIKSHKLEDLRAILSTGSPLAASSYDYIYRDIKTDIMLSSIAGGTDIIGCFFAATSDFPVYRGMLSPPSLGFKLGAVNSDGEICDANEPGDLVCFNPFPSMPRSFLNDASGEKYDKAYFKKFNHPEDVTKPIWAHGDFIQFNDDKFSVMLGRSDATLNPNGVRFGTADLYSILEQIEWIEDSLAIPQRHPESLDERVILFIKQKNPETPENYDVKEVKTKIRVKLSARHVPSLIFKISDIPYTISGKKVEVAVRDIVGGKKTSYRESFKNPESLELYQKMVENGDFKW